MKIVIIGAGPAGVTVAETLCRSGFEAEITLLSAEPYPPYSPPAITEYFLTGKEIHLWRGRDYPAGFKINYRSGSVVKAVRPAEKSITLADGSTMAYDRLVLASGSRLFAPLEGQNKPGIYNLKSLSAAEEILRLIRGGEARSAIIIGAGFIGVEIGLTLADMGLRVTQLVRSRVLRSVLDEELSLLIEGIMERRGVNILRGAEHDAVELVGEPRVNSVKTQNGDVLKADLIIAATGMSPNIGYLQGSGITIDTGVMVDERMRTNVPDISAVGDMVIVTNRVSGERYVHGNFPNAFAQAQIAAYDLLGWDVRYDGADTMNSLKHLGIPLIAAGRQGGEEICYRKGDVIRKIYLRNSRVSGFRLAGDIRGAGVYRTLMNRRTDVTPFVDRLLDGGFGMGYMEDVAASPARWQA
jgi:NAD(P)H-nitrite reductase large subunit